MDRLTGPVPYRPRTDLVLDRTMGRAFGTAAGTATGVTGIGEAACAVGAAGLAGVAAVGGVAAFGGVGGGWMAGFSFVKRRSVAAALM